MLHTNIKFLRESQRLSQEKWGAQFGITRGMVDSYERDAATPNPATLAKIALHYDITIDTLIQDDFSKNPIPLFNKLANHQTNALVEAKDELIQELKEQIKFLRNQNQELTKKISNG